MIKLFLCFLFILSFACPALADEPVGGIQVLVDGKETWPPKGPGCDKLIKCCDTVGAKHSDVKLFCQLAVADKNGDCVKAQSKVRDYLKDRKIDPPKECKK